MSYRTAFVLIVASLLVSCIGHNRLVVVGTRLEETVVAPLTSGTPSIARQQLSGGKAYVLGQHTIAVPSSASESRARQLVRNVRVILDAFERDHSRRITQPLLIVITDKSTFDMPVWQPWLLAAGVTTIQLTGVCCNTSEIAVVSGELDCLPSLYHEFCHAALPDAGGDHANPLWREWNERGDELSSRIRSRWH